jgi:two-component system heavy metal sensor histidine kinase CusS
MLLVRTGTGTAIVLVLSGCLLYGLFRAELRRQFDRALDDKATLLASAVSQTPQGLELDFTELDMQEFVRGPGAGFLQMWEDDGAVLYRSASLGDADLLHPAAPLGAAMHEDIELPGDVDGRAVILVFRPRLDEEDDGPLADDRGEPESTAAVLTLVLARQTGSMSRVLGGFGLLLLAVILLTILVMSITLSGVIGQSLKPLAVLTDRIADLDDRALSVRLPEMEVPDEFRPVIVRLNELLDRLENVFRRERAFSADVAHELRTPLAGLRSTLEVALSRPRSTKEYQSTLGEILAASGHLQKLVDNLLSLTRIEAGTVDVDLQPVALARALHKAWEPFQASAEKKQLDVRWDDTWGGEVLTDEFLLMAALRNIVDNAVSYTKEGGEITLAVAGDAMTGEIRITNSGCELTQEEAEELCDRFRRRDAARSVTGVHYGLGLALVSSIMEVLEGKVLISAHKGRTYEVLISVPRGPRRRSGALREAAPSS